MIIYPNQLQDIINTITALKMKYKIFYVNSEEADKELPPPDTVYIYIIQK